MRCSLHSIHISAGIRPVITAPFMFVLFVSSPFLSCFTFLEYPQGSLRTQASSCSWHSTSEHRPHLGRRLESKSTYRSRPASPLSAWSFFGAHELRNTTHPSSHANTSPNRKTAGGDPLVALLLRLQLSRGSWGRESHINLRVGNIDIHRCETPQHALQSSLAGSDTAAGGSSALTGQMSLQPNATDIDSVRLNELDDALSTLELRARVLEVVIVVVELCLGVHFLGDGECDWDERLADGVVEDRVAVCTILVQSCELSDGLQDERASTIDKPSFTTSQRVQLPLYLVITLVMWLRMTSINVALSNPP